MQVMIIGCGKIGRELAIELLELGEEVVVVDRDPDQLNHLKDYDIVLVNGMAIDIDVLHHAGMESADVVLCVSDNENLNIMSGQIAKHMFNVEQVIVRTSYADNGSIYEELGLTPVCTTKLTVERIIEMIGVCQSTLRIDFFGTPVDFSTLVAEEDWYGQRLLSLENIVDAKPFGLIRNSQLLMASLDIRIEKGDLLIVCKSVTNGDQEK
ncbi:MAG: potassium channel family protein [Fastidiosipilaceae bacterium]|jgi:trk system potassium uptake protein TrkA|nr:TrkA family potassium uptake protein [Clostridiaceae bacterium]